MINLLPKNEKREITAGRTNGLLVRYIVLSGVVVLFILAAFVVTWFFLQSIRSTKEAEIESAARDSASLESQRRDIEAFKSNLSTAKTILDKRVNYSDIILRISSAVPSGVVLDQLTLDAASFGTPTTLNAKATSESAALRLKESLNASPYFSDTKLDSITATDEKSYPFLVTITTTLTPELKNG